MSKTSEISRRRIVAHEELLERDSKVYRAFLDLERAAFADGALPKKTKELVAVGISVVINCESCMQWHIEQAAKAGADEHEVFEAVEVAIEMVAGLPPHMRVSRSRSWPRSFRGNAPRAFAVDGVNGRRRRHGKRCEIRRTGMTFRACGSERLSARPPAAVWFFA
jgi:AhpD family alkylhydroperoxidase